MPASGERRSAVPMRFAWGVLVGLSLTLFVLSMPARYEELAEVGRRASAQLGPRDDLLLHFLSRGAYAPTVLSLEVVFVLALTLASVEMVWRNWSDWRPLFFSAVFVTYSVWVTPTLDALGLPPVLQTLADLMQAAGLLMAIHFFLLFPDGCFVPRWIRLNARVGCVLCGVGPFPQHAPEPYRPVRGVLWGVLDPDAAGVVRRVGGARGTLPPGGFTPAHPDEVGLARYRRGVCRLRERVPAGRVLAGIGPGSAPLRSLRRLLVLAARAADPRRANHRDAQVQPLRRERPDQPHPRLRLPHGDAWAGVLRRRDGDSGRLSSAHRPTEASATGYRRLHSRHSCSVQPLEASHPVIHRRPLLPQEVRR